MEKMLSDETVGQIKDVFARLKEPVQILFFGSDGDCDYCGDTRQLLEEVTAADNRIGLSIYDLAVDTQIAKQFNVDKAPGIVIAAKDGDQVLDFGIQYSGITSGHEFGTLIHDIVLVSGRDSGLSEQVRDYLKKLDKPLHLQVFVTPTCPYCPSAVLLAHRMAMENPRMVRAEGVEATEFPDLSNRFGVSGVPQTVINAGAGSVVGAVPENQLFSEIRHALAN
jgi:glutaredoxin-like protein